MDWVRLVSNIKVYGSLHQMFGHMHEVLRRCLELIHKLHHGAAPQKTGVYEVPL